MLHIRAVIQCFLFSVWLNFTQDDTLQVHPCCFKWHYFILFSGWVIFPYVYVPHLLYPLLCQWMLRLLPCLGCCKRSSTYSEVPHASRLFFSVSFASLSFLLHPSQGVESLGYLLGPFHSLFCGLISPKALNTIWGSWLPNEMAPDLPLP